MWLWLVGFIVEMVRVCGAGLSDHMTDRLSCGLQGRYFSESLYKEGDVIIGGLFPVHNEAPAPDHAFTEMQHGARCQG